MRLTKREQTSLLYTTNRRKDTIYYSLGCPIAAVKHSRKELYVVTPYPDVPVCHKHVAALLQDWDGYETFWVRKNYLDTFIKG
jgi:hypothetical protein